MDFFARTEMDKHTLDAHSEYKRAVEAFVTQLAAKKTLDEFANTDHYWAKPSASSASSVASSARSTSSLLTCRTQTPASWSVMSADTAAACEE
jgi:hypothetical protein